PYTTLFRSRRPERHVATRARGRGSDLRRRRSTELPRAARGGDGIGNCPSTLQPDHEPARGAVAAAVVPRRGDGGEAVRGADDPGRSRPVSANSCGAGDLARGVGAGRGGDVAPGRGARGAICSPRTSGAHRRVEDRGGEAAELGVV